MATKRNDTASRPRRKAPPKWGGTHADRARALAAQLESLARALECDATPDDRKVRIAATVDAVQRAVMRLDGGSTTVREARKREDLLSRCRGAGEAMRTWPASWRVDGAEENLAKLVITGFANAAPEEKDKLQQHAGLVVDLIRAHHRNTGGRGKRPVQSVAAATEALCDAMGWDADAATVKRTKRRRKPPGH